MKFTKVLALLSIFALSNVHAMPILLETISARSVGSGTGNPALTPVGVIFKLGYADFDCSQSVGCEKVWELGETGSIDFNSGNSALFSSVVVRMTDSSIENLWSGAFTVNAASANVFPGSSGGSPESMYPLLIGSNIDFLRLIVTETTLTGVGTSFSSRRYIGSFEVWGSLASSVPAPATLTLFAFGLVGLGWSRRKTA
ncbi:PEP-CTERM sorting domain-containing protein [Thalassotalea piscium]